MIPMKPGYLWGVLFVSVQIIILLSQNGSFSNENSKWLWKIGWILPPVYMVGLVENFLCYCSKNRCLISYLENQKTKVLLY